MISYIIKKNMQSVVSDDNKIISEQDIKIDVKNEGLYNKIINKDLKFINDIKKDNYILDNTYQSCCFTSDKRALDFFTKSIIILGILLFSMFQVIHIDNIPERNNYLNIIILILGTFLPSPSLKQNKEFKL